MKWTQAEAIALCERIEAVCPDHGCHVALTGGLLYKSGARKDADILFYRIRQVEEIDVDGLMDALADLGIERGDDFGWCFKATWQGKPIDFFFPERPGGGDYPGADEQAAPRAAEPAFLDDIGPF
jgi:hypothetical protein